ncbi:MAG: hypothetical protein LJE65_11720 [Desulfobacteraceae bacterium]|nr:hypothetical protein [Desulfobacteraceae bacterium]
MGPDTKDRQRRQAPSGTRGEEGASAGSRKEQHRGQSTGSDLRCRPQEKGTSASDLDKNHPSEETFVSESAPNEELSFDALDDDEVSGSDAAGGQWSAHGQAAGEDAELSLDDLDDMAETRPATEAERKALEREISGAETELSFALISDLVEPSVPGTEPDASLLETSGNSMGPNAAPADAELHFEEFLPPGSSFSESGRKSPVAEGAPPTVPSAGFPARPAGAGPSRRGSDAAPAHQGPKEKVLRDHQPQGPAAAAVSHPRPPEAANPEEPSLPDGFHSISIPLWAAAAMVVATVGILWFLFLR